MDERRGKVVLSLSAAVILLVAAVVAVWWWRGNSRYDAGYAAGRAQGLEAIPSITVTSVSVATTMTTVSMLPSGAGLETQTSSSSSAPPSLSPQISVSASIAKPTGPPVLTHGILLPDDLAGLSVFTSGSFGSGTDVTEFGETGDKSKVLAYGLDGTLYFCEGRSLPKPTIVDSANDSWTNANLFISPLQGWGTDLARFKDVASAKKQFGSILSAAKDCAGTHENAIAGLGDSAIRLDVSGDQSYNEEAFVLVGDVILQVGLTTGSGQAPSIVQQIARVAYQKYTTNQ